MLESNRSVVLGVGVAAATAGAVAAAFYFWPREDDGGGGGGQRRHASSRQTTVEMKIPAEDAGVVIGRRGENVKEVQRRTNTKISFKDELATESERVLEIRGTANDVQMAQVELYRRLNQQPRTETRRVEVNASAVGGLIGRGGENVRRMQNMSRCRIDIQRGKNEHGKTQVTLKGTPEQLQQAERMILAQLEELEATERRVRSSVESRPPRSKKPKPPTLFLTAENGTTPPPARREAVERLVQATGEESLGVFVSAISDPGRFYVQKVGPRSIELDKLVQDMTEYYRSESNRRSHLLDDADVSAGCVVAARWPGDDRWYRARVVEVVRDEYDDGAEPQLDVDFVDFGDCDKKNRGEVFDLRADFLRLSFQAIECCLAGVEPIDGKWSDDAADDFERLSRCAQWKELQAVVVDHRRTSAPTAASAALVPMLQLVDTSGSEDVNIGMELVRLGHAREVDQEKVAASAAAHAASGGGGRDPAGAAKSDE